MPLALSTHVSSIAPSPTLSIKSSAVSGSIGSNFPRSGCVSNFVGSSATAPFRTTMVTIENKAVTSSDDCQSIEIVQNAMAKTLSHILIGS